MKTIGEIVRRWRGGFPGTRPFLPVSTSIRMGSPVPGGDFSDPILALADVDLAPGVVVDVAPTTPTVKRTSSLTAIANAFARTPTGRLTVTDAGVVDWTSDVDHLFIDTTQSASAFVAAASGENGVLGSLRPTIAPGGVDPQVGLGPIVTAGATNGYQIVTPLPVYFGSGANVRQFPSSAPAGFSAVVFRGFRALAQSNFEILIVSGDLTFADAAESGALVQFCECRIDPNLSSLQGGIYVANCALQVALVVGGAASLMATLGGYCRSFVTIAGGGGEAIIDQDFACLGTAISDSYFLVGNSIFLGNVAIYNAAATTAFNTAPGSGAATLVANFDAAPAVAYGSVATDVAIVQESSAFRYDNLSAVASFVFNVSTFVIGKQTSSYAFDEATGAYVGPTTNTLAHLDAAIGAGTGFGGVAVDPRRGSFFGSTI
ncbi:MAG: hypothetical protein ACRDNM_00145 [Gaiellaceae bacterium]